MSAKSHPGSSHGAAAPGPLERLECDPDDLGDTTLDVERDAERMRVRRAVERLPEPLAEAAHRYYYRGETMEELAAGLGVSRTTVFDRVHGALGRLTAELGPKDGTGGSPRAGRPAGDDGPQGED
ncbi:MAG: sigma-70 family RNA polymerase sigma factor [Polyangiaceae bacterium]